MSKRFRNWSIILLFTVGLSSGAWWAARPKPIEITVASAERGTVEKTVANTRAGTVKACRRAKLSPSVGGQIAKLPIHEGDVVKTGQLLLELWNNDLVAERELARRESMTFRASAKATCLKAEELQREATRLTKLQQRNLVADESVDRAVTEARASEAECTAAQGQTAVREARIDVIGKNLDKTRLTAPFDGVIAKINGELNEYVTPSPPGILTPPAVDLINNGCFYVTAPIDEVDVADVGVGQSARVKLDAFGDREFVGKVRRIADYVLDLEKQARTVDVEVEFINASDLESLLAGYSADVEIILKVQNNTLRIPTEAVLEDNKVYVFSPDEQRVAQRTIRVGIANWDHSEILEGLAAGEWVVTSMDREGLADGVAARRETKTAE